MLDETSGTLTSTTLTYESELGFGATGAGDPSGYQDERQYHGVIAKKGVYDVEHTRISWNQRRLTCHSTPGWERRLRYHAALGRISRTTVSYGLGIVDARQSLAVDNDVQRSPDQR